MSWICHVLLNWCCNFLHFHHICYILIFSIISSLDSFTVESKNKKESYTYVFQLCGDAGGIPGAAVIQVDAKKTETKPAMIGTNDSMEVIRGSKCLYKNKCYTLLCADSLADVGWSYANRFAISQ